MDERTCAGCGVWSPFTGGGSDAETDLNLIAVFEECIYVYLGQDGRFLIVSETTKSFMLLAFQAYSRNNC